MLIERVIRYTVGHIVYLEVLLFFSQPTMLFLDGLRCCANVAVAVVNVAGALVKGRGALTGTDSRAGGGDIVM